MTTKDACAGTTVPPLATEEDGVVWIPNYVHPTPLSPFDFDIIRHLMLDPAIPPEVKMGRRSVRKVQIFGVGQKSGEFMYIYERRKIFVRGSSEVIRERGLIVEEEEKRKVANEDVGPKPVMWTETVDMEDEDEMLATVAEEFPLLTDYSKDALEVFKRFDD